MGVDISLTGVSDFDQLEIVKTGTITTSSYSVSPAAGQYGLGSATDSITHNLGYIPIVLAYMFYSGLYQPLPFAQTSSAITSAAVWFDYTVQVTNTTLFVQSQALSFGSGVFDGPYQIKYYLLRSRANK